MNISFSKDIGIDLGTANVLVTIPKLGIVYREASAIAIDMKKNEVLAVGNKAKEMIGRTPDYINAIRPLKEGVIADFDVTAAMLKRFIGQALKGSFFSRVRMVICVPTGNPNKTLSGFGEDSTRLPEFYDGTYQYLKSLGLEEI